MIALRKPATVLALGLLAVALFSQSAQAGRSGNGRTAVAVPLGGINLPGLGGHSTPSDADREIADAVALHAKVIRAEFPWTTLQPRGSGALDASALAYTDRLIGDAAQHGISVIALIDATPCWASAAPAQLQQACLAGSDGAASRWPPARPEDFAALVGALAQRYGDRLTALEVWNEPDHSNERYFAGPNKPERYAAILKAGYAAVKLVDPNIKVLAGSLVGANGVFLRLLYAAGIKGNYDGLAVHFYTLTLASIRAFRSVQLANGDSTPLWLDEFGWSSCYPRRKTQEEVACVTTAVQAENVRNVFRALSRTGYVAAETLFKLHDSPAGEFGVLSVRGARKPSYSALAGVLSSPLGPLSRVTLGLRRTAGRIVASGSAPVGDYMGIEVFQGSLLRYRAVFTLDRLNRYSIALPKALGTRGLRVRTFQYWTGLRGAAQKSI